MKIDLPYHPAITLLDIYMKECALSIRESFVYFSLLQHYSQYPSCGSSLDALQLVDEFVKKICKLCKWLI
jgi:hypothetical protein